MVPTQTNPPPKPGHADTLQPDPSRAESQAHDFAVQGAEEGKEVHTKDLKDENVGSQEEMLESNGSAVNGAPGSPTRSDRGGEYVDGSPGAGPSVPDADETKDNASGRDAQKDPQATSQEDRGKQAQDESSPHYDPNFWEPKPPKVLMNDPNTRPLELRSQIQLYATNE